MVYVSKQTLSRDARTRLDKKLAETFVALKTLSGGERFLSELLTPSEHLMLAKRLTAIFMLSEGVSQYRIKQTLRLSSSTVARLAHTLDAGGFEHIVHACHKKKDREILWHDLEKMLRLGMPSMGIDRWDWLDELYKKK